MAACGDAACDCSGSTLAGLTYGAAAAVFRDDPCLASLAVLVAVGVAVYAGTHAKQVQPGAAFGRGLMSSPVLLVWTVLLGTIGFRFPAAGVLVFTALAGLGGVAWLRRRAPVEAPCCGPDCDCHTAGQASTWEVAPEAADSGTAQAAAGGWINAVVQLEADVDSDWAHVARRCLEEVVTDLAQRQARLQHLKLLLTTAGGSLTLTQVGTAAEPTVAGDAGAPALAASLILNARAEVSQDDLKGIVEKALAAAANGPRRAHLVRLQNLRPGGPVPPADGQPVAAR